MLHDPRDPTNTALAQEEARLWDSLTPCQKADPNCLAYRRWRLANDELMAAARPVDPDPAFYATRPTHLLGAA